MPTGNTKTIVAWKSKELSEESIKAPITPVNNVAPKLKWIHDSKIAVEFKGSCLKQDKATFTKRNVVDLIFV